MIDVYIRDKTIITHDKGDKQFLLRYGAGWEKVSSIKESHNYQSVIDRITKQYSITDVVKDCVVKRRFGWRFFTAEEKEKMVLAVKRANTGVPKSDEQKARMAAAKRGKRSNAFGSRKSATAKMLVAIANTGVSRLKGRVWCYNPDTCEERRLINIPDGWRKGRTPELRDWWKNRFER